MTSIIPHRPEPTLEQAPLRAPIFSHRHLLGIQGLSRHDIIALLDLAETYIDQNRRTNKKHSVLAGRTLITLFYENSTRTQSSFELAGKRLGADTLNMSVKGSSVAKGETLIDTAITLNAMRPDLLVLRHAVSGSAELLSQKVDCAVINAGDGTNEHPTQALLDALTVRRRLGSIESLRIVICGDVLHSRVARSNIYLLTTLGAEVQVVGPPTLVPTIFDRMGVKVFHRMEQALAGADVVMMLRLQTERMAGAFLPSAREFFHLYGLDRAKLAFAKPGALVMHPGPMNRGVEIDSIVADDPDVSLIQEQVEMGVAVRMAVLDALARNPTNARNA